MSALTKIDPETAVRLSGNLRNRCPGFSEIGVRDLLKPVSGIY